MAFAPITPPGWVISGPHRNFLVHLFPLSPAAAASEQEIFLRGFLSKLGANKTGLSNKRVLLWRQNLIFLWLLFAVGWWFPIICVVIWGLIIRLPDTLYIYEILLMVKARDWWPCAGGSNQHTETFRYGYDVTTYLKNKEFVKRNQLWAFCEEEKW